MRVICQACGKRVVRYISRVAERKRKNKSGKHWKPRGSHGDKQHDLCRQCFRSTMEPITVIRDIAVVEIR